MKESLFHHPAMNMIRESIRRDWWRQWIAALILLGISVVGVYWFFGSNTLLVALSLSMVLIALVLVNQLWQNASPDHHPLFQILREEPERIIWVYGMATQWMPFGIEVQKSGLLYIKLIDGKDFCLSLPHDKLKLVSRTLRRVLPQAVFGYNPERAEQYRVDPKGLLEE